MRSTWPGVMVAVKSLSSISADGGSSIWSDCTWTRHTPPDKALPTGPKLSMRLISDSLRPGSKERLHDRLVFSLNHCAKVLNDKADFSNFRRVHCDVLVNRYANSEGETTLIT